MATAINLEKIKDVLRGKAETFTDEATALYRQLDWKWKINGEERVPNEEDVLMKLFELVDALQLNEHGYWVTIYGMKLQYKPVGDEVEITMSLTKEIKDMGKYKL
jgi:hypothetical protein